MPEDAKVDALRRDIYDQPAYKDDLEHKKLPLYKPGDLNIEPSGTLHERALNWLHDPRCQLMQPEMIDVIALAESRVVPAKRSHASVEESSEAGDRSIRKLGVKEEDAESGLLFNIHNYLWGRKDLLSTIREETNKKMPDEGSVEDEDEGSVLDEGSDPFAPHFMIQDEYKALGNSSQDIRVVMYWLLANQA
ncbi:uncharacterized protein FOMMEDRAFT_155871 [Fomitiporia mediterranea MF3/22]|uniref:uncharacterized protein n=1 Tax=Fomitiporia mediterranea (strain MF3/22) TaxID=694068 RepID=UPI00044098E0|nr:uncharacterized protein FOMMEDRAFT_155871 [Fomitiporia mediterranea MF3/22]EJD02579.1 hypothetical protein FOMMEDRAFT_155871 [Fomitiporia mediterranea MF3/22]